MISSFTIIILFGLILGRPSFWQGRRFMVTPLFVGDYVYIRHELGAYTRRDLAIDVSASPFEFIVKDWFDRLPRTSSYSFVIKRQQSWRVTFTAYSFDTAVSYEAGLDMLGVGFFDFFEISKY